MHSVCVKLHSTPEMLPFDLDDDKMNVDEEAISKLLAKYYQQQNGPQPIKICSTPPQPAMPETGQLLSLSVSFVPGNQITSQWTS